METKEDKTVKSGPENEAMNLPAGSYDVKELMKAEKLTGDERQAAIDKCNQTKTEPAKAAQPAPAESEESKDDEDNGEDTSTPAPTPSPTPAPSASTTASTAPKGGASTKE